MTDNRVLFNVKMNQISDDPSLPFLTNVVPEQPAPSMIMSAKFNDVSWFRLYLNRMLEEETMRFEYGRVDRYTDPITNAKVLDYIAVNTDQYYAAIVNLNARYLQGDTDMEERLESIIKAYLFPGVLVQLPRFTSLTPYNCFDPPTAARVIIISAFLIENFCSYVIEDNLLYFESVNIFSYEDRFCFNPKTAGTSTPSMRALSDYLIKRADSCDFAI